MEKTLLSTKLNKPTAREGYLHRVRLFDKLNANFTRRFILVSAPAGFGKTTLVSEWVNRVNVPFAWVSLDDEDNDTGRFLVYLIASLNKAGVSFELGNHDLLHINQPEYRKELLIRLVNILSEFECDLVIVLDDYHLIREARVHDVMSFLLDFLPDNIHLLLITRADPPISTAKLQARNLMGSIRLADLRFDKEETHQFLNNIVGIDFPSDQIDKLLNRTEGWVAGLQMASLSLQDQGNREGFFHDLQESDQYILEFLLDEVLDRQEESIQDFLLCSCVSDELCGPLCEALIPGLKPGQGEALLNRLVKENLFLYPLKGELISSQLKWYRYHNLFASLLQGQLKKTHPDVVSELHLRASSWFEYHQLFGRAVEHAVEARDYALAANLLVEHGNEFLINGEYISMIRLLELLPEAEVLSRPQLLCDYLFTTLLGGQSYNKIKTYLDILENHELQADIAGQMALVRAIKAVMSGDGQQIIENSEIACELIPERRSFYRSLALRSEATGYLMMGDYEKSRNIYEQDLKTSYLLGDKLGSSADLYRLGYLHFLQGKLIKAEQFFLQALDELRNGSMKDSITSVKIMNALGDLYREWNDFGRAKSILMHSLSISENYQSNILGITSNVILANIARHENDYKNAQKILNLARELAIKFDLTEMDDDYVNANQALLWIEQKNFQQVRAWAVERQLLPSDDVRKTFVQEQLLENRTFDSFFLRIIEKIILLKYFLAVGEYDELFSLADPMIIEAKKQARMGNLIELQAVKALALYQCGQKSEARNLMVQTLTLAEPESFQLSILDLGDPVVELLGDILKYEDVSYAEKLIDEYRQMKQSAQTREQPLTEPLSQREIEVLGLMAQGKTNQQIAEKLFISERTVKFHAGNIYGKLGVKNRVQAVNQAKSLNLFSKQ